MKRSIAILLAVAVIALWSGSAYGFHDQGVADCAGCHTMHNSQNGAIVADGGSPGQGVNAYLLKAATPSDTCLACHAGDGGSYHVLATDPLVPTNERGAGDFVFLTEDNVNDGHAGASNPIPGYAAGHNINAPGHGISTDPVLATAPGGTFPSADLACSSCHDPHGTEVVPPALRRQSPGAHRRHDLRVPQRGSGRHRPRPLLRCRGQRQPHRLQGGHERLVRQLPR